MDELTRVLIRTSICLLEHDNRGNNIIPLDGAIAISTTSRCLRDLLHADHRSRLVHRRVEGVQPLHDGQWFRHKPPDGIQPTTTRRRMRRQLHRSEHHQLLSLTPYEAPSNPNGSGSAPPPPETPNPNGPGTEAPATPRLSPLDNGVIH
jgi:hypothetical protein